MTREVSSYLARRRAFTLVELLVVIGIIALLISILLPTLSTARASAKQLACMSNMRQLGIASNFFLDEHDGWIVKPWQNTGPRSNVPWIPLFDPEYDPWEFPLDASWDYVMMTYLDSANVLACPSDNTFDQPPPFDGGDPKWNARNEPGFANAIVPELPASYALNTSNQKDSFTSLKVTQVKSASSAFIFVEMLPSRFHHASTADDTLPLGGGIPNGIMGGMVTQRYHDAFAINRHSDRKNSYVFYDGHAETVKWENTWKSLGAPFTFHGSRGGTKVVTPTPWRTVYAKDAWNDVHPFDPDYDYDF